ncbi:hypothetical protein E3J39_03530 [Candidatus Bathyarchaeota archaeon]|nr:MAG: hypothetical protein E3J39_03530 [Candidatus Bathyarchaeota archaeon]
MGLLEWLGGVKKGQYDEAIARCDVIEENLQLRSRGTEAFARLEALQTRQVEKERELSELKAENAELREITRTDVDSL